LEDEIDRDASNPKPNPPIPSPQASGTWIKTPSLLDGDSAIIRVKPWVESTFGVLLLLLLLLLLPLFGDERVCGADWKTVGPLVLSQRVAHCRRKL